MAAPLPQESETRRPSLARELLVNLGLLTAGALSLAVATTLFVQSLAPRPALAALVTLIVADVAVLYFFGRHLVRRLVLQPVGTLIAAADAIARGDLAAQVPPADTAELARLALRINEMTGALRDAQDQLVRAEKLAGIGRLAAGIAHEVGNPLAAIANYVAVLRARNVDPDVLADLEREIARIDAIVRGLLAYGRADRAGAESSGVEVAALVDRVLALLERQGLTRGRSIVVAVAPSLPPVRGSAPTLEQVLVNLLLNALDAAPQGPIEVEAVEGPYQPGPSARVRRADGRAPAPTRRPSRTPRRPGLLPGTRGVLLVVSDHGPGVAPEERERIFDPFVTTKEPGAGTGLGLAVAQRIVYEAGGLVWVDDARGGGAAFKVFLPVAATAGTAEAAGTAGAAADGGDSQS